MTPAASLTRRAISASTSGEKVPRMSFHLWNIISLSYFLEVLSVDSIGTMDCVDVPILIPCLVAAENQVGVAAGIEGKQYPEGPPQGLNPQFLHVGKSRSPERVHIRTPEFRTVKFEQFDARGYTGPFLDAQAEIPLAELVADFDFPSHRLSIPFE